MQAVKSKLAALHAKHQEALQAAVKTEGELAAIIAKAEALESLAEEKTQSLNEVEDSLDAAESKLQTYTTQLCSEEKSSEESLQARKQLENRGANDTSRIEQLEKELEELTCNNKACEEKLVTIQEQLIKSEEELDQEDERVEKADTRVKVLESEVTQVGNSLRSMEICEKEGCERVSSGETKMSTLESKFKDKEKEATELEAEAEKLEEESDGKDEELNQARSAYDTTKLEFDALIAEIAEI